MDIEPVKSAALGFRNSQMIPPDAYILAHGRLSRFDWITQLHHFTIKTDLETGSLVPIFNRLHPNYKYTRQITTDRLRKTE